MAKEEADNLRNIAQEELKTFCPQERLTSRKPGSQKEPGRAIANHLAYGTLAPEVESSTSPRSTPETMRPLRSTIIPLAQCAGFSLMEMLVTVAIIGVLSAMLVPTVNKTIERGRMAQCNNTLRQLGTAF